MKKILMLIALMLCLTACGSAEEQTNFGFTYQGIAVAIDAEAAPVIEALGDPKSYTEETSCAFDGVEKTYHYGSFYLATYPKGGVDHVARIWFADDSIATQEGICIGSSKAAVEAAYGKVYGNEYISIRKESRLIILLENEMVTSIQYDRNFQ